MIDSENLLKLREEIYFLGDKTKSPIEYFQHKTLRPVLKFLNKSLNKISLNYIENLNSDFVSLNQKEQEKLILTTLKKEQALKNKLAGLVIGLFTQVELDFYLSNNLKIEERIHQMIQERVKTQFIHFLPNNNTLSD